MDKPDNNDLVDGILDHQAVRGAPNGKQVPKNETGCLQYVNVTQCMQSEISAMQKKSSLCYYDIQDFLV